MLDFVIQNFESIWSGLNEQSKKDLAFRALQTIKTAGVSFDTSSEPSSQPANVRKSIEVWPAAVADGFTVQEISSLYSISHGTVRNHLEELIGVGSRRNSKSGPASQVYTVASVERLASKMGWEKTMITSDLKEKAKKTFDQAAAEIEAAEKGK